MVTEANLLIVVVVSAYNISPIVYDDCPVPPLVAITIGRSLLTKALNVGIPAIKSVAAKTVFAICDAKFEGRTANVPPSVNEPVVLIDPLNVKPLIVPEPVTCVTVPKFEVHAFGLDVGYAPRFVNA